MRLPLMIFIVILQSCQKPERIPISKLFPTLEVPGNEWAHYEGKWLAKDGYVQVELSLKIGAFGLGSNYRIHEVYISDKTANGSEVSGNYTSNGEPDGQELQITLEDVGHWKMGYLHYNKTNALNEITEEIYFLTRGNEELIPCDNDFTPLTEDWRYTLHRRSDLFTVEGYVTFDADSATYYERNVMQKWPMAKLGMYDELKSRYHKEVKGRWEGIYVKGLAYSVADSVPMSDRRLLVIKDIRDFNNDPD